MNKEILQVPQHAQISFAPRSYSGNLARTGDSQIEVAGTFTLLDQAHEIIIPMRVHLQEGKATINAQFSIPYVQWGLKDPSLLFWRASKDVSVDLNLAGEVAETGK